MKYVTTALLCASLGAVPLAALAQNQPPPAANPNGPSPEMRQQFDQMRSQMESMHAQYRSQILGALTPAHRTLVQQIAGQLAVGQIADRRTAATQLDNALSAQEKQAVIAAHEANRQQMRTFMEQQRAQFEAQMTPEQRQQMQQREANRAREGQQAGTTANRQPDAGMIVLRAIGEGGGPGGPGGFRVHDADGAGAPGAR